MPAIAHRTFARSILTSTFVSFLFIWIAPLKGIEAPQPVSGLTYFSRRCYLYLHAVAIGASRVGLSSDGSSEASAPYVAHHSSPSAKRNRSTVSRFSGPYRRGFWQTLRPVVRRELHQEPCGFRRWRLPPSCVCCKTSFYQLCVTQLFKWRSMLTIHHGGLILTLSFLIGGVHDA